MSEFARSLAVSDTHHNRSALKAIVRQYADIRYIFHLGDNVTDAHYLADHMRRTTVYSVRGNCDPGVVEEETELVIIKGQRILLTHGHRFHVKYGLDRLYYAGSEQDADAVLFGHTHVPYSERENGIWFINPGSAGEPRNGEPTVAILLIGEAGIVPKIVPLRFG